MNPAGKPEGLRQAMAWFHTWAGLLLGWLMFAIFVTGTLSFYRHEITQWIKPELQSLGRADAATPALALARLQQLAPDSNAWFVSLPDERQPALRITWRSLGRDGNPGRFETRLLDPASGAVVAVRDGLAGDFFYRFHFELRSADKSRWIIEGRWLVCIATAVMLAALLSGVVTHRRLFADFFTFRPRKGGQRAWLDGHNVAGVLVLPFYLVISFSGLLIFHTMFLPAGIAAAYGPQSRDYFAELRDAPAPERPASAGSMPTLAVPAMLAQARERLPGGRIDGISVQRHEGGVRVELRGSDGARLQYPAPQLVFDGVSGQLLANVDARRPVARTYGVLYGLHMAQFAGPVLRALLFGFGVVGSLMIASGLVLWTVKRRERRARSGEAAPLGQRIVEGLNIGTLAGVPLAVAAFVLATQWLPAGTADRADVEIQAFFATWGLALAWGLAAPRASTWRWQFMLGSLAFAALPLTAQLAARVATLQHALPPHGGGWTGVDSGWLAAAAVLLLLARAGARRARQQPAPVQAAHGLHRRSQA